MCTVIGAYLRKICVHRKTAKNDLIEIRNQDSVLSTLKAAFDVFQGKAEPSNILSIDDSTTLNVGAERTWKQPNQDPWGILFLLTPGSTNNDVKKSEGKRSEDKTGNGQGAWKALKEKYRSHTHEARRRCHEKLINTKVESGQDPDGFFFALDECRQLLKDMGQKAHDERCEDIILQTLPYNEKVRITSYEKREFGLNDIRHMVHTMYNSMLASLRS